MATKLKRQYKVLKKYAQFILPQSVFITTSYTHLNLKKLYLYLSYHHII